MKKVIDTRDLAEIRDELKGKIYNDFIECFPQYEEMTDCYEEIRFQEEEIESWVEGWEDEISEVSDIDLIEDEVGSEFGYGTTLVLDDYFTEFVEDMLKDLGYISKNFPTWIEIDWEATAENVKEDYIEVKYLNNTYYARP